MKKYTIGIDFGTLSARAVALNTATGEEAVSAEFIYPHGVMDRQLPDGQALPPMYALQHPRDYLDGLQALCGQILQKIPKGAWFCIFTPEGKTLSSEAFAEKLKDIKLCGKSSACFLIGSSFGIAPQIKQKADFKLSMGPMTFPHHLARIMVLEQLYRGEAIQAGSKYHK